MPVEFLFLLQGAVDDDRIVVTASRREETVQSVPAAISVIDGAVVGRTLPDHPAEAINRAAGALVQAGSGQEHLTSLRSPVLTGGAGAGSFLYLQDGVPLRSAGFANINGLFDTHFEVADRIEVVRGPGDVVYGANALHGSINLVSPDPLGDAPNRLRLSAGAFDRYRVTGEWSAREGAQGVYAALTGYSDGGYRDDSSVIHVKGQLAHGWESGATSIRTRVSFQQLEQETAGYVGGEGAYADDDARRSNPNPEAFRDVRQARLMSDIRHEGAVWNVGVTPYALWTDMAFRLHFLPSKALEENDHWAVGVLSSAERALGPDTMLIVGADLEYADGGLFELQEIPRVFSYTPGVHYDYAVSSVSAAPFVRLRHEWTERLAVQAGVRLNHTSYDYDNRTADGVEGRFQRPADRSDDFSVVTAKLGATYRLDEATTLFASLARGARPPQESDLYRLQINEDVAGIEPETLDMAEAGIRHDSGAFSLELVAYAGRKEHFQFRDADGFTVSDGETTHRGLEVSGHWQVTGWLAAYLSGSFAQHKYGFDRLVTSQASEVIRGGTFVDTAPKTTGQAGIVLTPLPELTAELSLAHVGAYFTDAANAHTYPGHDILDLSVSYDVTDRLRLGGVIRNLADERYATRADYAFGSDRYFPGEERAASVSLTVNW